MKWKKLGKIFDPTYHPAFSEFAGFAQSPQALILGDRVRVYFSIRKKDRPGKFLSHVAFVDFNPSFSKIIGTPDQPVVELGGYGTFDEHGIFPFSPIEFNGRVMAYTCGWSRRISVSVETATGLVVSDDGGKTFFKHGNGPVMSSSLREPFLVGDSFVRYFNGEFQMWYIFGSGWIEFPEEPAPDRVYKIAHATSKDGVNWHRNGVAIIPDVLDVNECQALPSVIFWEGKYRMIFCFRHATGFRSNPQRGYRLGYAYSMDMKQWIRDDKQLGISKTPGDWDGEMMCYPHIFVFNNQVYLLYNGNEFGKYGFGLAILESI